MALAFQCDLCEALEAGEPLGSLTYEIVDPDQAPFRVERVLCTDCSNAYQDWCFSRMPEVEPDDESDDHDEPASDEYPPMVERYA